uniref:Uncharacterized protein n=1 Tax=Acrobeloides nanus TaxID=290746 RepID=A0A914DJF6_9BILA
MQIVQDEVKHRNPGLKKTTEKFFGGVKLADGHLRTDFCGCGRGYYMNRCAKVPSTKVRPQKYHPQKSVRKFHTTNSSRKLATKSEFLVDLLSELFEKISF